MFTTDVGYNTSPVYSILSDKLILYLSAYSFFISRVTSSTEKYVRYSIQRRRIYILGRYSVVEGIQFRERIIKVISYIISSIVD